MSNAIAVSKKVKCHNKCGAIVGHDLLYGSPSTQNVFEDKGSECVGGLNTKGTPFRPSGKGAPSLHDVTEASCRRHKHGVNVCFAKEGYRNGDSRRDPDFGGLAELALVAGGDVLSDIMSN